MLVKDVVVEPSIADCKAGKFASIPVAIPTALNGSLDQPVLQKLFVEKLSVAAEVSDQVADLGPDSSVFMLDEHIQIVVKVRIVDRLIEVLGNASQLGH